MSNDIRFRFALDGAAQVRQQSDTVTRGFNDVRAAALRAGPALGAVAAAVVVGQLRQITSGLIDQADALGKLSRSSGIAVEQLSALAEVGRFSGHTAETLARASNDLSKKLSEQSAATGNAGNAVRLLGLDFASFIKLSPAERMQAVAQAMSRMEDGATKTAAAMELFGRADIIPFLSDLASKGMGAATVTSQMAAQAEKLNDQIEKLKARAEKSARSVAAQLVPELLRLTDTAEEAEKAGEGLVGQLAAVAAMAAGRAGFGTLNAAAEKFNGTVNWLTNGLTKLPERVDVMPRMFKSSAEQAQVLTQRLGEAEQRLAALRAQLAGGNTSIYLKSEIGDVERLVAGLRQAKAARDALNADGAPSGGAGRGRINPDTVGQMAAKEEAAQRKLAEAMLQYGTATEKANAEVAKWKATLGSAFTPELERRIRANLIKPTKDATDVAAGLEKELTRLTAGLQAQIEAGGTLSAAQQLETRLSERLADNVGKVTAARMAELQAMARGAVAAQKALDDRAAQTKALVAQARAAESWAETITQWEAELADSQQRQREAHAAAVGAVAERVQGMRDEAHAAYVAQLANVSLAEAIEMVAIARMEERRAALVNDKDGLAALDAEIAKRRELLALMSARETRDAAARGAADLARAWQTTTDGMRADLIDALRRGFEAGGGFVQTLADTLRNELRTAAATALVDAGLRIIGVGGIGGGAAGAGGAASSAALMQYASAMETVWGYGKAAYSWLAGAGAASGTLGTSTAAYTSMANSQVLAAYGVEGVGATAGGVTGASAGGTGAAASWGAYAGYAAMIYAAAQYASKLYGQGFTGSSNVQGKGWYELTPESLKTDVLKKLGLSDKWSEILGGSVRLNHMFGHAAPRLDSQGVSGTFGAGGFSGQAYADIVEKGGLFRSDRRSTQTAELDDVVARFFTDAASSVYKQAAEYGEVLGLPAQLLRDVSTDIKVAFGEDQAENEKAIAEALAKYGDALVESYSDALRPLAVLGESASQTLMRVGTAVLQVNSVLEALGLAALDASVDGGRAALQISNMLGGMEAMASASGAYFKTFYTDAERAERLRAQLTASMAELGAVIPETHAGFRALVDAAADGGALMTDAGQRSFAALLSMSRAVDELLVAEQALAKAREDEAQRVQDMADALAERIRTGLDSVVADFARGQDLATYRATRVQQTLAAGGITAPVEAILGATRADVEALWRSVGDEGKAAILEAYSAWAQLRESIDQTRIDDFLRGLGVSADELSAAYAELRPQAENIVQQWRRGRDEVKSLADALADIDGTAAVSALDALRGTLRDRAGLQSVMSGNTDRIAQLWAQRGDQRAVDMLRQREARLWADFAGANNPDVARAITDATLQRIQIESDLQRKANEAQISALQQQISAAEKLRLLAMGMDDFLLSLRAGDLSTLGYAGRLDARRQMLDRAIESGGDVQGQAVALLQQAQRAFGGATPQYGQVVDEVEARLRAVGLTGLDDAALQIDDAQRQLQQLMSLSDGSLQQIEALGQLNTAFATGVDALTERADQQRAVLDQQLAVGRQTVEQLEAVVLQAGIAYTRIIDSLHTIEAAAVEDVAGAQLAAAAPRGG